MLDAKQKFWSYIMGEKQDFCSTIMDIDVKQDFCSNISGAKQDFCSNILGA